jgi:hypothetical protein
MRDKLERLRYVWRAFQEGWEQCHAQWHDAVADRFLRDFIEPWGPVMDGFLRALDQLDRALEWSDQAMGDD